MLAVSDEELSRGGYAFVSVTVDTQHIQHICT